MFKQHSIQMNFFHQTFCIPKTIYQVVRLQAIQTIRMPNTIHQLVRFQAIQAIQTLYHPLVDRAVFSVKSALGINIFWVKKGL
ncbi:hypothetical protein ID0444_10950 [Helicobacter pylori]